MKSAVMRKNGQTRRRDQATRLRELAGRRSPGALTVAITSGKGGVGKTNIAVNLSICLAAKGLRVLLVDVDLGLANADVLMNIHSQYTLSHVLSGVRGIEDVVMEGPAGVRFIPGASGIHALANLPEFDRQHLIAQLDKVENSTDIVVLDCGAGISRNVMSFAVAADRVVVVTTAEPTAMTDGYAIIKSLHQEQCGGQVCLFVNMVGSRADAAVTYHRVASVAKRFLNFSIADQGYMLHDTAVELAVRARCPFVIRSPGSNASASMAAMADELARSFVGQQRRGGFFSRIAGLFV